MTKKPKKTFFKLLVIGQYKFKPTWDITTHSLEKQNFKYMMIPCCSEDIEQLDFHTQLLEWKW